jgi:hypothetical protein
MNMVIATTRLDVTPVPFVNPFTQAVDMMPLAMVQAYVPYASHLNLEEAAKVAAIRDTDEANTLLLSINQVNLFAPSLEGCGHDELSVEAPSLR